MKYIIFGGIAFFIYLFMKSNTNTQVKVVENTSPTPPTFNVDTPWVKGTIVIPQSF